MIRPAAIVGGAMADRIYRAGANTIMVRRHDSGAWIALAIAVSRLEIVARPGWRLPWQAIALQLNLQAIGFPVASEYLSMAPYIVTIVVLVVISRMKHGLG